MEPLDTSACQLKQVLKQEREGGRAQPKTDIAVGYDKKLVHDLCTLRSTIGQKSQLSVVIFEPQQTITVIY